jgi:hypothetical protein
LNAGATSHGGDPSWLRALIAVAWIGSGASYLTLPPSPDQFEFAYMGWRMLEGDAPYRDFIDMNFPGGMWLQALSTGIFGHHLWSWHALDFLLVLASAWPLSRLVEQAGGRTARSILLVLYPMLYASLPQWVAGQADTSGGQFLLGCLACHAAAYASGRLRLQLGTGVLLALAILNKPTLGVLGALLPLIALLARQPGRLVVKHTAVAALASVGALLFALVAVLLQGATLTDLEEAVWIYNIETQFVDKAGFVELTTTFATVHFVWWHFIAVGGLATAAYVLGFRRSSLPATSLVALWVAGVLSYFVQSKWYQYHLAACYLALAGLVCLGLGRVLSAWPASARFRWVPVGLVAIVFLATLKKLHVNYSTLPELVRGDRRAHFARFVEGNSLTVADALDLVELARATVAPNESLYVFGSASSVNFLSARVQPTRFFYAPVIQNATPPLPMARQWVRLFANDLARAMPRLCVVERADLKWLRGHGEPEKVLRRFLEAHYRPTDPPRRDAAYVLYARR